MEEIIVAPKDGKPAFYFSKLEPGKESEKITTDRCFRCFAGMLVMNKKKDIKDIKDEYPSAGVYVWHILPGCKTYVSWISNYLFKDIAFLSKSYNFEGLFCCGGLINDPYNEYRYQHMYRKIETRFSHLYPQVPIRRETPVPETLYMILRLEKNNFFIVHEKQNPQY